MEQGNEPDEPAGPDTDTAEKPAQVHQSAPAEEPEPEVPAHPEQAKPLEERLKGREHTLKTAAIIVSICALIATGASATAAWLSLQASNRSADAAERSAETARRALDTANQAKEISDQMRAIAQEQYETAGAIIRVDPAIEVRGMCGSSTWPAAKAIVHFSNLGRSGVNLSWVNLSLRRDIEPLLVETAPIASHPTEVELEGQHGFDAVMLLDCADLAKNGLAEDPANQLIELVRTKPGYLTISWYGPSVGYQVTDVLEVQHTG